MAHPVEVFAALALGIDEIIPSDKTCRCDHPHGECLTCGCPLLAERSLERGDEELEIGRVSVPSKTVKPLPLVRGKKGG
jgi:hypothetical protein